MSDLINPELLNVTVNFELLPAVQIYFYAGPRCGAINDSKRYELHLSPENILGISDFVGVSLLVCEIGYLLPPTTRKMECRSVMIGFTEWNCSDLFAYRHLQPISCIMNQTTGVPEWNWTGIEACEQMIVGCNLTDEMLQSPFFYVSVGYMKIILNVKYVGTYSKVWYMCPNGEVRLTECLGEVPPRWEKKCNGMQELFSLDQMKCALIRDF